jgi:WD40 repeat protein
LGTVISAPELITQVAITPDGELAVSGYSDKTLRVWKLASGTELAVFTLDAAPGCCAFFPDAKSIVAGDADGTVHFFSFERPQAE